MALDSHLIVGCQESDFFRGRGGATLCFFLETEAAWFLDPGDCLKVTFTESLARALWEARAREPKVPSELTEHKTTWKNMENSYGRRVNAFFPNLISYLY